MRQFLGKYNDVAVSLSVLAAAKIDRLILSLSTEVGFYGLVEKEEKKDKLILVVKDILIYPQKVSNVTTITDDLEMAEFFMDNVENINKIRYHGHSHAQMPTSPSTVDVAHMQNLVSSLKEDEFYIFQIFNKFGSLSTIVYMDGLYYSVPCYREIDQMLDYSVIS